MSCSDYIVITLFAPERNILAMRMATIGQMQPFDPANDRISKYLERVQLLFQANGIADNKKVPALLSIIGGGTYTLLSDLLAPDKPSSKTVDQLTQVLVKHYEPKPVVIAERFQFHWKNQATTETVAEYEAELRRLATHCAFGDYLSEAIRDCIVCGLRNKGIQKRLLAKTDLNLAKTLEITQRMEAADQNAQKLKGTHELNLRVSEISRGTKKNCYRCGREQHGPTECPYREVECQSCKKKGHLARMCQSRSRTGHKTSGQTNTPPCELLMGRPLRTRLDLLRPNLWRKVLSEQAKQKQSHDEHSKDRQFKVGDAVWIRDFRSSANKWEPGILVQRVGPVSYII